MSYCIYFIPRINLHLNNNFKNKSNKIMNKNKRFISLKCPTGRRMISIFLSEGPL